MKRFAKIAVSFATTIAMVMSTFPCAAFADEILNPSDSVPYEASEVAGGADNDSAEDTEQPTDAETDASNSIEAINAPSTADSSNAGDDAGSADSSDRADSVGDSDSMDDAGTIDEGTLTTIEIDVEDLFTYETYTDAIDLAIADGETATSAVETAKQRILAGYASCAESVTFNKKEGITYADTSAALTLAWANSEYYWASSRCNISFYDTDEDGSADDDEIVGGIFLYYYFSASELSTVKQATEAKIAEALSWIDEDEMSAFEVVQALHDYLVRNCVYDLSASTTSEPSIAHSAYGALVNNKAVCQGYALAYKLLLARVGIPVVFVQSKSMNHAWNMVQLDGSWYHIDATWDDPVYSDGTDTGFDADVSHTYFLRADSTMKNSLKHYGWEAAYATPSSDYANRTYGEYKTPATTATASSDAHVYAHSATATSGNVTFKVEWDDPTTASEATTFHVTQTGGSSEAKVRMDVPTYWDNGSQESVCDPTRGTWSNYETIGRGHDCTFELTASGTYRIYFYFMDQPNAITYLRTTATVTVDDAARPSVSTIVSNAVAQAKKETDGSEYAMALLLHDWTLDQLEYDYDLNWCSAESGLTRGKGTCESYQRIYAKLLDAAGIANGRITGNGHTWNAVKIDGKWCQMDLTWDDSSDNWYGDFDQRHIYFGLTDELMAIAHSDHTTNYQAGDYKYRSTDLSNNYFVRNGKAAEWADAYAERIQTHLDAGETNFTIDADNASYPPGICGIQNEIIASVLNQRTWTTSKSAKVKLTATSKVTTESNAEWTAVYNFTATYPATTTSLSGASVSASGQTYTGSALTPAPTVKLNGTVLKQGTDYTVVYSNNVNAGTAKITVTGKGSYTGTATGTFAISAANASGATVKAANQTYTGKAFAPAPTVTLGSKTLKQGTDYTAAYADNIKVGTATVTVTFKGNYTGSAKGTFQIAEAAAPNVVYQAHVQDIGWQKAVRNGATAGTSGRSLRVEAVKLWLENAAYSGGIQIRAHVQDIGWQDWSTTGGTSGRSLRVEAMQIRLTGELANHYDVYYRVHAQNFGWMGWSKNGAKAGSSGYAYRLEAVQIVIVKKGASAPGSTANAFRKPAMTVQYQAHVENIGWQGTVTNGATAGTSGRSLRVEALRVSIGNADYDGGIQIRSHVQDIGWQGWSSTGGTSGRALRMEAIQIRLTGELANHYDVYYRVHAQNFGWMGWAKNGQEAGSAGYAYRLEAVQIRLVAKGGAAPGSTAGRFKSR